MCEELCITRYKGAYTLHTIIYPTDTPYFPTVATVTVLGHF
jgi:hypothetical protein